MGRGPFGVTKTKLPGVLVCEHLPKLAARLDLLQGLAGAAVIAAQGYLRTSCSRRFTRPARSS